MNKEKLTIKEKNEIFEKVWEDYSKPEHNKIYFVIAAAAMFAIMIFSGLLKTNENQETYNANFNQILEYEDIYQDEEIIFDDSVADLSKKEINEIIAKL